ncbi:hypothetical protein RFI_37101, partial [Reticulomyxa filosa]
NDNALDSKTWESIGQMANQGYEAKPICKLSDNGKCNMATEKMKSADVKVESKETTEASVQTPKTTTTAAAKTEGNKASVIQRLCDRQRERERDSTIEDGAEAKPKKRVYADTRVVEKEWQCKVQDVWKIRCTFRV